MYRDMWERAMDEGLEMLLQVNTEDAYFLGSAQVTKFGRQATFSPQVNITLKCGSTGRCKVPST